MLRGAITPLLIALLSFAPRAVTAETDTQTPVVEQSIQVLFSPAGGCTDAIIEHIATAKKTLDVQAYSFTSAPIAKSVVDAHRRGVKVRVILDKSQRTARYTSATYLFNNGVPTFIDSKHAIAHNKIMLIDGQTIITGSFNFSKAAEQSNAENLLIITGFADLVTEYQSNFDDHFSHSDVYDGIRPQPKARPTTRNN